VPILRSECSVAVPLWEVQDGRNPADLHNPKREAWTGHYTCGWYPHAAPPPPHQWLPFRVFSSKGVIVRPSVPDPPPSLPPLTALCTVRPCIPPSPHLCQLPFVWTTPGPSLVPARPVLCPLGLLPLSGLHRTASSRVACRPSGVQTPRIHHHEDFRAGLVCHIWEVPLLGRSHLLCATGCVPVGLSHEHSSRKMYGRLCGGFK